MKRLILRCAASAFEVVHFNQETGEATLRTLQEPVHEVTMKVDIPTLKKNGFTLTQEEIAP